MVQVGYPERLGKCIFYGAPNIFFVVWRAVKMLMDARLVSKARMSSLAWHQPLLPGLTALPVADAFCVRQRSPPQAAER